MTLEESTALLSKGASVKLLSDMLKQVTGEREELREALDGWVGHIDRWHGPQGHSGQRCEWCLPNEEQARTALANTVLTIQKAEGA